jgi:uncharacterized membrane protein
MLMNWHCIRSEKIVTTESRHVRTDNALERPGLTLWLILFVALSLVAVSAQSFWIDELSTMHFANRASIREVWNELVRLRWPEIQAPFYMLYIWGWTKVFGSGEWIVRFAGVPWFVLGAVCFVTSWRGNAERVFASLAIMISPFVWFYLDEARLYSMQLGLAFSVAGALIRLARDGADQASLPPRWFHIFCLSNVLLSMVNVLGMIWASAALLLFVFVIPFKLAIVRARESWLITLLSLVCLGTFGIYYVWTRRLGISPTDVGRTDWRSICFIFYEQLGFNGLGPGRLALRQEGVSALKPWLGALVGYGAVLAVVLAAATCQLIKDKKGRILLLVLISAAFPASFLILMGSIAHFRVLGRHFTPFATAIIILIAIGTLELWKKRKSWAKVVCSIFLVLSAVSCLAQRFGYRHAKDDYRGAACIAVAKLNQAQSVWWNAAPMGGEYYKVPTSSTIASPGQALMILSPGPGFDKQLAKPDIVIMSTKSDIYDHYGNLASFLSRECYLRVQQLSAFAVFQRPLLTRPGTSTNELETVKAIVH